MSKRRAESPVPEEKHSKRIKTETVTVKEEPVAAPAPVPALIPVEGIACARCDYFTIRNMRHALKEVMGSFKEDLLDAMNQGAFPGNATYVAVYFFDGVPRINIFVCEDASSFSIWHPLTPVVYDQLKGVLTLPGTVTVDLLTLAHLNVYLAGTTMFLAKPDMTAPVVIKPWRVTRLSFFTYRELLKKETYSNSYFLKELWAVLQMGFMGHVGVGLIKDVPILIYQYMDQTMSIVGWEAIPRSVYTRMCTNFDGLPSALKCSQFATRLAFPEYTFQD